jgi:DNA polymerase sigma
MALKQIDRRCDELVQELFLQRIELGKVVGDQYRKRKLNEPKPTSLEQHKPENYLEDIIHNVNDLIPTKHEQEQKRKLLDFLKQVIQKILHEQFHLQGSIHPYGSCASGFGLKGCDIDATIIIDPNTSLDTTIEICDMVKYYIRTLTDRIASAWVVRWASTPIINIIDVNDIQCDISINGVVAIENTKFLKAYCALDTRVQQLGVIVKAWAKSNNLVDAANGSLNSYIFILMVIWFLQQEKIVPNLQDTNIERKMIQGYDCTFYIPENWTSPNTKDIRTLTIEFFKTCFEFNFRATAMSIRTAGVVPVDDKYVMHVEDPFELRNLGSGMSNQHYNKMKQEMRKSYVQLSGDKEYQVQVTPGTKSTWRSKK